MLRGSGPVHLVDDVQPMQEQVTLKRDLVPAERYDVRRNAARCDYGGRMAQLLLHAVEHAVEHCRGAVHYAASHGVHSIAGDYVARLVKVDAGKLRRAACERVLLDFLNIINIFQMILITLKLVMKLKKEMMNCKKVLIF